MRLRITQRGARGRQLRGRGWRQVWPADPEARAMAREAATTSTDPHISSTPAVEGGDDFTRIPGIYHELACLLRTYGYATFADLAAADDETLLALAGIGPARLQAIREFDGL